MSWLFSQALVAEYSGGTSLDGEPSAPLSVMPTAHKFWRRGKTIESCDLSLFGLTCAVLTDADGEELLTSFLLDFPARTSAPQERGLASTVNDQSSGAKESESSAKSSPPYVGLRTAQHSLFADSTSSSQSLPAWGSMRNGVVTPRMMSASTMSGRGRGYSHSTPSGVNGGRNNTMGRVDEWGGSSNRFRGTVIGSLRLPSLEEMVMGWPIHWTALTPFATDRFHEWSLTHSLTLQHEQQAEQAA